MGLQSTGPPADKGTMSNLTDAIGLTVNGGTWNDWDDMPTRTEMRLLKGCLILGLALVPVILHLSN